MGDLVGWENRFNPVEKQTWNYGAASIIIEE